MCNVEILELLQAARQRNVSDILMSAGAPILFRQDGELTSYDGGGMKLSVRDMQEYHKAVCEMAACPEPNAYPNTFSMSVPDMGRVRVCIYQQRGTAVIVMHIIENACPTVESLGIPGEIASLTDLSSGLVLIGGDTGSGRTSTLAALVDRVNHTRAVHVMSISEPLEYLYRNDRALVTQVECQTDASNVDRVLDSGLRQSVDVLAVDTGWNVDTSRILRMAAAGKLVFLVTHGQDEKSVLQFFVDLLPAGWRDAGLSLTQQMLRAIIVQKRINMPDSEPAMAWGMFTGRLGFESCQELRHSTAVEFCTGDTQKNTGWLLGEMLAAMTHEHMLTQSQFQQLCPDWSRYNDVLRRHYEEEKTNPLHAILCEREQWKGGAKLCAE